MSRLRVLLLILAVPVLLGCIAVSWGFSLLTEKPDVQPSKPAYQSLPWVSTGGPVGGLGYDIRMDPRDPDVMYVTDAWAGTFKSVDGGQQWFPINQGIAARVGPSSDGIPVFSLTIDPNRPDTLWAGTQFGGGVFRSDDAGRSWRSMSNGILERALTIRGFAVQPGNSDVVYLGGEISSWEWNGEPLPGLGLDMVKGVVYKTINGGLDWERIWYGDNLARYIWIHPEDTNLIYVSTGIFDREAANSNPETLEPGGVGILRSRDGGQTWEVLGQDNGIRPDELYYGSLSMHPQNPAILIGAAGNDPYLWALQREIGAIYRTGDGGDSWQRVLHLPNASAVEICESDPNVVYAASLSGFYRSDDNGLTWQRFGGTGDLGQSEDALWGPPGIVAGFPIDMQCDLRDPMRIFVNNYGGGNFLSEDGGEHWVNASQGYTGALMHQVVVSAGDAARVYASARSGVFSSSNGGQTWQGLSHGAARAMEAYAIAVDPQDSDHVITVIGDSGPVPKVSHDGGQTWYEADPELWHRELGGPGDLMRKIVFHPRAPAHIVAIQAQEECPEFGECEEGHGVILSDDGGQSWQRSTLRKGIATDVAAAPDGSLFVAMYPDDLYRSFDFGHSWELVSAEIASHAKLQSPDPHQPGAALSTLLIDPVNPNRIYAGFMRAGIMLSEDGGVTWRSASMGMNPESTVTDLVADPAHPGVIYVATLDSGVYLSTDYGDSWTAINEGLFTRAAVSLALSRDGRVLYLATEGGGVFRLGTP